MQAGRFTVGDFALFTSYLANIGFSISLFGYMVFQHKRLKVSFDRMRSLFRPGEEDWIIEARETYLNEEPPELPVIHREPGEVLKELEVKIYLTIIRIRRMAYRILTSAWSAASFWW